MQIPVLIEPVSGRGFRATGSAPFAASAEGATIPEAVDNLRTLLEGRLSASSAQVVCLDLPTAPHPLAPFAGIFQGDPLVEEWKQIMAENRRLADQDPDLP